MLSYLSKWRSCPTLPRGELLPLLQQPRTFSWFLRAWSWISSWYKMNTLAEQGLHHFNEPISWDLTSIISTMSMRDQHSMHRRLASQASGLPSFSNGDGHDCQVFHQEQRVGSVHQYMGRLSSCNDEQNLDIPQIYGVSETVPCVFHLG